MSKVVSLDLEMNPISGKIIQVGYIIGDCVSGRIFEKKSYVVNPYEELQYCREGIHISELTGITQERIDKEGVELAEAYQHLCQDIKKYNPTTTCVQWGDGAGDGKGDHDHLRRELGLTWNDFIFRARAWDVKSLFQIYRAFNRQGVALGLEAALKTLGMEFVGRQHDALDDACNTFYVFRKLGSKMTLGDKISRIIEKES
jgi:ERI1 exoribonuclease 2